ncbi:hypothetical protein LSTR_LSTR016197 [Laodelphax striatellus]|uniref:Uncharacterized protein n=1 Tax=Laodelphax striatellus TaxID=195883 RepID=A0A482XPX2_LAOST|nr:hypothetical protein LSTR_LSTR012269 [Laodelphax striatellus]RZF47826.1 hypothetical protein LSTR_LSTR016197 [Laodelphax striatellus]
MEGHRLGERDGATAVQHPLLRKRPWTNSRREGSAILLSRGRRGRYLANAVEIPRLAHTCSVEELSIDKKAGSPTRAGPRSDKPSKLPKIQVLSACCIANLSSYRS